MADSSGYLHWPPRACRLARLLPDDFRRHRRAARRERLLGWRSLLDAAIERLAEPPTEAAEAAPPALLPEAFWEHCRAAREEDLLAVRSLVDAALAWLETWLEEPPPRETVTRVQVE